jgi:hypothetical protein
MVAPLAAGSRGFVSSESRPAPRPSRLPSWRRWVCFVGIARAGPQVLVGRSARDGTIMDACCHPARHTKRQEMRESRHWSYKPGSHGTEQPLAFMATLLLAGCRAGSLFTTSPTVSGRIADRFRQPNCQRAPMPFLLPREVIVANRGEKASLFMAGTGGESLADS